MTFSIFIEARATFRYVPWLTGIRSSNGWTRPAPFIDSIMPALALALLSYQQRGIFLDRIILQASEWQLTTCSHIAQPEPFTHLTLYGLSVAVSGHTRATMDATKFILETRQELLDYANDYSAYASRLSTRLRSTKKRLNIQDKNPAKHHSNLEVSASQLARNPEYVLFWFLLHNTQAIKLTILSTDLSMLPFSQPNDAGPNPWPGDHEMWSIERLVFKWCPNSTRRPRPSNC